MDVHHTNSVDSGKSYCLNSVTIRQSSSNEKPAPIVSIVIPAYNEEEMLPRCLESLGMLDASPDKYEVIVVDNGSCDRTREIAASFGCIVLCDPTLTVAGLRNLGANHAQGKLLAFIDADCLVTRDWLKNALRHDENVSIIAWGSPPDIPEPATWIQRSWNIVRQKKSSLEYVDWLESMNFFIRKADFQTVGGFNSALQTCEDVDISYRLKKLGMILADSSIRVIHLGEADSLREFLRKESWRGKSNLEGIRSHGISWQEIPSLAVPLYFAFFWPISTVVSALLFEHVGLAISLLIFFMPSMIVLVKQRNKRAKRTDMAGLLFLLQLYFLARAYAIVRLR